MISPFFCRDCPAAACSTRPLSFRSRLFFFLTAVVITHLYFPRFFIAVASGSGCDCDYIHHLFLCLSWEGREEVACLCPRGLSTCSTALLSSHSLLYCALWIYTWFGFNLRSPLLGYSSNRFSGSCAFRGRRRRRRRFTAAHTCVRGRGSNENKMSQSQSQSFPSALLTLLLPFSISLFLYLSITHLLLPFWRSQSSNLPLDTVSEIARRAKSQVKERVGRLVGRFRKREEWDEDEGEEEDEGSGMLNYEEDRGRLWRGSVPPPPREGSRSGSPV